MNNEFEKEYVGIAMFLLTSFLSVSASRRSRHALMTAAASSSTSSTAAPIRPQAPRAKKLPLPQKVMFGFKEGQNRGSNPMNPPKVLINSCLPYNTVPFTNTNSLRRGKTLTTGCETTREATKRFVSNLFILIVLL
jgi:hypothetical protein